jgi:hypothetical protein
MPTDMTDKKLVASSAAKYMKTALFWDITQRVMVISYWRFGTTYWYHLQGSRILGRTGCPEMSVKNDHYWLRNRTKSAVLKKLVHYIPSKDKAVVNDLARIRQQTLGTNINPFRSYFEPRLTVWFSCSAPMSEDVLHRFCCVCSPAVGACPTLFLM